MVVYYEKRMGFVVFFELVNVFVGDDIGGVFFYFCYFIWFDELRILIFFLVRYDVLVVKFCWFMVFFFVKVLFVNYVCLVLLW